jgi:hypothetical protein
MSTRVINIIDTRTGADQIIALEHAALDRWGQGDPGGFLESYAVDITYFDPGDGHAHRRA